MLILLGISIIAGILVGNIIAIMIIDSDNNDCGCGKKKY